MARIVHLANFVGPRSGGLRTALTRITDGYHAAGHEVHVVIPSFPHGWKPQLRAHVHSLPSWQVPRSGGYRVVRPSSQLFHLLDEISPDHVELSDRLTLLPAADWARHRGVPSTFIAHERVGGVLAHHLPLLPSQGIADRANRALAARVTSIVATTRFAAEEFTRLGIPSTRIPLGVEARQFTPRLSSVKRTHMEWVMCSRLSKEKDPHLAVEVVRVAHAQGRPVHLTVLGDGPLAGSLQRAAHDLPITFHGFVPDRARVAQILRRADACLAPGPIETFGLAALESLACGTPVLCRDSSALPEVIADAGMALPREPQAWVNALSAVHDRVIPDLRGKARHRALELPWERTVALLLSHHGLSPQAPASIRRQPRSSVAEAA